MRSKKEIKETGATFTPIQLADYLANEIIQHLSTKDIIRVLDPACGDGILLKSFSFAAQNKKIDLKLTGYDADNEYLNSTRETLISISNDYNLIHKDFLETFEFSEERNLFSSSQEEFDAIIANPPYVRTQILGAEKSQAIAKKFNLKGRVDLYYPFLIGMTERLKVGGILGVITSNRYLYTKSGESVRQYLSRNYEIIKVIDFGDTKLFNASVLPAIFIGRKIKSIKPLGNQEASFVKVYEELNGNSPIGTSQDIFELILEKVPGCYSVGSKSFNLNKGVLRYYQNSKEYWQMLSVHEDSWIKKIEEKSAGFIKDFFKVRVGIKTTADKIFIRDDWGEMEKPPESSLLKPLISQNNIDKWNLTGKEHLEVLYTHIDDNGQKKVIDIKKYPNAKTYLESYRMELEGREYVIKANRKWYEIWVPQNPSSWTLPKLVFPDISEVPRFYYDDQGFIVNGNCYWIAAKGRNQIELLRLIQGIANSDVLFRYHELKFNNKLYSGKFRFFTQYVENYPIPDVNLEASKKIIELVKKLSSPTSEQIAWRDQLNKLVLESFSLDSIV